MQRVPIQSRLISSVAYNADTQTLHVWFRNRKHVSHDNVSEAIYLNLVSADSAGFYYSCYLSRKREPARPYAAVIAAKLMAACILSLLLVGASATDTAMASHIPFWS